MGSTLDDGNVEMPPLPPGLPPAAYMGIKRTGRWFGGITWGTGIDDKRWMFSPVTGEIMDYNLPTNEVFCPDSGFTRHMSTLDDKLWIHNETIMMDYYRTYDLVPVVKTKEWLEEEALYNPRNRVRATAEERCPDCGFHQMEYHTMQLRSADEGQTVFFECRECGHRHSTNT